jgi:nucleoside-diphosphate-sugar epimerase
MRVFVAGSTGVVGRSLVPGLVEGGHEVVALVRNEPKAREIEAMRAKATIADPLDRKSLTAAMTQARPEAIIHQLTALTGVGNFKKLDEELALTNRLRTESTDILIEAARLAGARRLIAQSFCGWTYEREGGPAKAEEDPLDPAPAASFTRTLAAIRHLEEAVISAGPVEGVALRYGWFYGPGTSIARDGAIVEMIRARQIPIVGEGEGIWSFIHIHDAVSATLAALTRGAPGLYNVVDDEPAPVSTWLPALADAVGAPRPRKLPVWLARFAIGEGGVSMMTRNRGASNAKARRLLDWQPFYPSWRRGFVEGLG